VRRTRLDRAIGRAVEQIGQEAVAEAARLSQRLRDSALVVLSGQRSGRRYRVPGTARTYPASAPGEAPAVRAGNLRLGWRAGVEVSKNEQTGRLEAVAVLSTRTKYAGFLDPELRGGTPSRRIKPRPFVRRIVDRAVRGS
jgi:plasmid stabilization system protein ParE